MINEHFEPFFNAAGATQIVFQQSDRGFLLVEDTSGQGLFFGISAL